MTLRWGIVGASNVAGEWVVDAIRQQPNGEVAAVFSHDANRARSFAVAQQIPDWFTDFDAMLASSDLDAVYISTTNEQHCPQTLAAAAAGKHVLCEKPLALAVDDANDMVAACNKAGVVLATNHHLRNASSHRAMRDAISQGRIGRAMAARVAVAFSLPEHLRTWRTDRPDAGGGVVLDATVHSIDALRFVLDDDPVEVVALTQSGGMARTGLEDAIMSAIRFKSGAIAQTHEAFTACAAPISFEVLGSEGTLVGRDVMYQRPIGTVSLCTAAGAVEIPLEPENLYVGALRRFHAAVHGEGQPAATGTDGVWSLAAALAVLESAKTGRAIRIATAG